MIPFKPNFRYQTLAPPENSGTSRLPIYPRDYTRSTPLIHTTEAAGTAFFSRTAYDTILISTILLMLLWPWVFFGVVLRLKGVKMDDDIVEFVTDHPHVVNFFVTLFSNIISLIASFLFSTAILRFSQEWITDNNSVTLFHVSVLSAFRNRIFPWSPLDSRDRKNLLSESRSLLAILVIASMAAFACVTPGTTSLVSPVPFTRTAPLKGTELDFSSTSPDCIDWLNANGLQNSCGWGSYKGTRYTSCLGENQMVDVLESGRDNILSLNPNNSESLSFGQLGADDGLHFLGPIRGVLPIGPDGVPAFDTVSRSPISKPQSTIISYNYTLELQGLRSDVKCVYDTKSPIRFAMVTNETLPWVLQYQGTCPEGADLLVGVRPYISVNSNNTLGFWACKGTEPAAQGDSYVLYMMGRNNYTEPIGNITCTVSPIQFATLPVTYRSHPGVFSTGNWTTTSLNSSSDLIQRAVIEVGSIINQAQNWQANLIAESVITLGVKAFNLSPGVKSNMHLRLYEAMIQGIIEYEATYIRLLRSTDTGAPPSCIRTVSGSADYQVTGWSVSTTNIGFLIPMTIVNLASLIIALTAVFIRKETRCDFDPTDAMPLALASCESYDPVAGRLQGWKKRVRYSTGNVVEEATTVQYGR